MLDPQKQSKLQELTRTLASQAQQAEKEGDAESAAKLYIKVVDVLLLLARESQENHSLWTQYTKQAEAYQIRVKTLISSNNLPPQRRISPPSPAGTLVPANSPTMPPYGVPEKPREAESQSPIVSAGNKTNPLMKIFKPFQKSSSSGNSDNSDVGGDGKTRSSSLGEARNQDKPPMNAYSASYSLAPTPPTQQSSPQLATQQQAAGTSSISSYKIPETQNSSVAGVKNESAIPTTTVVPYELFQQAAGENKHLREKVATLTREKEELASFIEAKDKELQDVISKTVPKANYEALQAQKLSQNEAAKAEIEKLESELRSSVPKSQYDELLAKISNLVPRELYVQAEVRAAKLELELRNTVPKNVLDDLASQVSLISTLSSIPMNDETRNAREKLHEDNETKEEE